jgi:hypothetical protein
MIGRDYTDRDDVVRVGDDRRTSHSYHWVEVACRQRISKVA